MINYQLQSRLDKYREYAAKWNKPSWKDGRFSHVVPFGTEHSGRGKKGERFTDAKDTYGEIIIDCNSRECPHWMDGGWYADNWQDSVIEYGVARIHHAKGTDYVPVTWNTNCDGATYHFSHAERNLKSDHCNGDVWQDDSWRCAMINALIHANRIAEREAEECREWDARDHAEQSILTAKELIADTRAKTLALLKERRTLKGIEAPNACAALTGTVRLNLQAIRDARKDISRWQEDFWSAVPNW